MWNTLKQWVKRDIERTAEAGVALSYILPGAGLGVAFIIGNIVSTVEAFRGKDLMPAITDNPHR